jgi:phosphatidylinositol glycan class W
MADYRAAKEAFVADNVGSSIWSINAVSLFGLVSQSQWKCVIGC